MEQATKATELNRHYYERRTKGRDDYWRRMAASRHRVKMLLRELDRLLPATVIDLGCGNGVLLEEVRSRHPRTRLAGIDLSTEQVEENRRSLTWGTWFATDLDRPSDFQSRFPERFDVVLAAEVIEHLDNPQNLLRNARELCRFDGHLLLSTQSGPIRETERRVGHRRHFDASNMRALLEAAGWTPERIWNNGFPFHDLSKWLANLNPDAAMNRFGEKPYGWSENLVCLGLRFAFHFNSAHRGAQLFAVARNSGSS